MRKKITFLVIILLLASLALAQEPDFYGEYYQPLLQASYEGTSPEEVWQQMIKYHQGYVGIITERSKLGKLSLLADSLGAVILNIPDFSSWGVKEAITLITETDNVRKLLKELGLEGIPDGNSWFYRKMNFLAWIAAAEEMAELSSELAKVGMYHGITQVLQRGDSTETLKDIVSVEMFALSLVDSFLEENVVGDVRTNMKRDRYRRFLNSAMYTIAKELLELHKKAKQQQLKPIECLELMALEKDYLAKAVDDYGLDILYWQEQRDSWSPLDIFTSYNNEEHEEEMVRIARGKRQSAEYHLGIRHDLANKFIRNWKSINTVYEDVVAEEELKKAESEPAEKKGNMTAGYYPQKDFGWVKSISFHYPNLVRIVDNHQQGGQYGLRSREFDIPSGVINKNLFVTVKNTDVEPGGNGEFVIVDSFEHKVTVLNRNGVKLREFGSKGTGKGQFETPMAVVMDPIGQIFVADSKNKRIQMFNNNGSFAMFIKMDGLDSNSLEFIKDIRFAPDNSLWVLDYRPFVLKIDANQMVVKKWGVKGKGSGQLNTPASLVITRGGYVYISDVADDPKARFRVQKFTVDGQYIKTLNAKTDPYLDGWLLVMAVDGSDNVWLADVSDDRKRIVVINARDEIVGLWGDSRQMLR